VNFRPLNLSINANSKVLFIYPHPDDETYANGALIQRLTMNKVSTKCVCLTKGGASTLQYGIVGNNLEEIRQKEFISVMKYLNVSDYEILDLEDNNLTQNTNLAEIIKAQISSYSPTHVITYEPMGIYGHKDHIIVSKAVFDLQKDYKFVLLYSTVSPNYKPDKDSLAMAENPENIKPIKRNLVLYLTPVEIIEKLKALSLYKSQVSIKHNFIHNLVHVVYLAREYYYKKDLV